MIKSITTSLITVFISIPLVMADEVPQDKRSGFYLSGGIGLHYMNYDLLINDGLYASETNYGAVSSVKIGGYLTPQFALYYVRDAAWWNDEDVDSTMLTGLAGIGGSYYFSPNTPSTFLEFGLGVGDIQNTTYSTGESGGAVMIGLGREITPHIQLSGNILSTSIDDSYYSNVIYETSAIYVKLEFKL
ncbi:outer membrane beta-barrel protein [Reinekea thalattae]|uniref:Outer membrane protein beta-barrel domain-containing protein n=1 Tax=Reinekea thalattae TaxID=2593301 RepID=A0A5C8ZB51_9GAMM|nr:outer membrane beta-barrel protein [Reinekea thalattae]TXR54030.1 hypothetical protein FME95_05655 [Reinekea thalattae]